MSDNSATFAIPSRATSPRMKCWDHLNITARQVGLQGITARIVNGSLLAHPQIRIYRGETARSGSTLTASQHASSPMLILECRPGPGGQPQLTFEDGEPFVSSHPVGAAEAIAMLVRQDEGPDENQDKGQVNV